MGTFQFRDRWRLPIDVTTAYAVLADVDRYAEWWPQVRRIERLDDESGHAFVRSLLPYTLDLFLTREVADPVGLVLRVRIAGDLEGWSQWRLVADPDPHHPDRGQGTGRTVAEYTLAEYTQKAVVTAPGLRRLVPVAGAVLRANHRWMMRSGQRGLVARLRA
ncbi:polyketide cyclase [Intrasporangium oryzae NRRL B-24470]|uniref:Polyketide cyclase n=1 Tax=Intrasporangium oryzae NRRL B-24470 TaxID=1386089 RepID=W9GF18_9MICO|nr:SRPBCC family protein [Intrasporangium oryzae]EWT02464.1 polyketide cyclase [Intrasporangium oryzae NRRL B-24470]